MLSAILMGAKVFASGVLEWVLKALSKAFQWLTSHWSHVPLVAFAIAYALHFFIVLPDVRAERDDALRSAKENLQGWHNESAAHAQTIASYREASAAAKALAERNIARVANEQAAINEEELREYQVRLGAARARYDELVRLHGQSTPEGDSAGAGRADAAGLPDSGADPGRTVEAASNHRFSAPVIPASDAGLNRVCLTSQAALIATEQALQLDALISLVLRQQAVNFTPKENP